MDIFSHILTSRPSTFTTFGASGKVENGFSPNTTSGTITTTGIGFLNCGFSHAVNTNLTYTGDRYIQPGIIASYEMMIKSSSPATSTPDILFSFGASGSVSLQRVAYTGGTQYKLVVVSPSGSVEGSVYTSTIPSVDYIALTVTDESFNLYINGSTVTVARPPDMLPQTNYTIRGNSNRMVYFSVIREFAMPQSYHDEIYDAVDNWFTSLSVDATYNGTSFVMDEEELQIVAEFDLTSDPSPVYTTEPSDSYIVMPTQSDTGDYSVYVNGTQFSGIDLPLLGLYNDTNAPEEAYSILEGSSLRLLGTSAVIQAANMPDRTATISPGSLFSWDNVLPSVFGSVTIDPDSLATVDTEYPDAYSMWVYLSSNSPGVIVSGGGISLSVSNGTITSTGTSNVYVDGVSTTAVSTGWRNISFVPSAKQNPAFTLSSASVALHSFTALYTPSPTAYIATMYNSYINPPKVVASESYSITITEQAPSIYDNKWSIKAVD